MVGRGVPAEGEPRMSGRWGRRGLPQHRRREQVLGLKHSGAGCRERSSALEKVGLRRMAGCGNDMAEAAHGSVASHRWQQQAVRPAVQGKTNVRRLDGEEQCIGGGR